MPNFNPYDNPFLRMRGLFEEQPQMPIADQFGMDMPNQGGLFGQSHLPVPFNPDAPSPFDTSVTVGEPQAPGGLPEVIAAEDIGRGLPEMFESGYMPEYDINARMLELYQPEHAAIDRYNELVAQAPERNKPGIARKIAASLMGFSGNINAADRALYDPYYRQVDDWKLKLGPAGVAANQERYQNQNERMIARDTINAERYERRLQLDERKRQDKEKLDAEKLRISELRAKAYDFKARNPNWKSVIKKGGNVMFYNPADPRQVIDSGLPAGTLTDMDRLEFEAKTDKELIGLRGQESRKTVESRGEQTRKNIKLRDELDDEDEETGAEDTPAQLAKRRMNRVNELRNRYPQYSKWVDEDGNVTEPSTGGFFSSGPDKETWKKLNDFIFDGIPLEGPTSKPAGTGKGKVSKAAKDENVRTSVGSSAGTGKQVSRTDSKLPEGKILVISPEGVRGYIPMPRLKAYLDAGYKKAY